MAAHIQLGPRPTATTATWTGRAALLWLRRHLLLRMAAISLLLGLSIALLIPNEYESNARIMPPDPSSSGSSLMALMAARSASLGPLASLATGLVGTHTTTGLFISLLQSGTVTGDLVNRFQLQSVYKKRYYVDAVKRLARKTSISDDKKSGVITIEVADHDPGRAHDLVQGYLEELNKLVRQTSNSAARQERMFLEQRLRTASADLEHAETALSEYSTRNNTIDLKEQTRAMVDAGARVEGELVLEQSTLNSLRQVYGDGNIRVRQAEARIGTLERELRKVSGSSSDVAAALGSSTASAEQGIYPALRQLPRLGVAYADLYRSVRIQETVFELLTQQYESARIEEAKDIPAVNVIDAPGIPEKKSFPPRTLLILLFTAVGTALTAVVILLSAHWNELPSDNQRKLLIRNVQSSLEAKLSSVQPRGVR
jgi:capsule polysaccharide export protein KpsE/RkpR